MPRTERGQIKDAALKIFGGLSESYDPVLDYATLMQDRRWKSWALANLPERDGRLLLDLGCGTGVLEQGMGDHAAVVGLDLTTAMLREAQRKKLHNLASLVNSDGELLPFSDASFDAVVCCYVVKYTEPASLVSEVARVLKPGGRLVLYDFARPRGPLFPLNAVYVYGGLRALGKFAQLARSKAAYTFIALPEIIATRTWDEGFEDVLSACGLLVREKKVLSGGVAVGFVAEKPPGSR